MKKIIYSSVGKLIFLALIAFILCGVYLTYNTYGNFSFAWQIRGKKLFAFILVAIATGFSTISFQTLTQNHFLTPSILGLDSLYVLIQTLLFFLFGGVTMLSQQSLGLFLGTISLMVIASLFLSKFMLGKSQNDLFLLLMIGLILGTLFSSGSTFLQVLMDPNEYDLLQGKLFASFGNVDSQYLLWAAAIIIGISAILFWLSTTLDVLHLGREQAINLGINLPRLQILLLVLISGLTGTATALVGPVTFLGFIVANISYQFMGTFKHRTLFVTSGLLGIILLVGGQFLVEQVFRLNTTLSVIIEFVGGVYFVGKLVYERKRHV
ncbi:iron chelate uptake ABC transporter family permease subunit [Enterococcus phoeniculicola]|jgi:iron complex transport system permease protein|uniref:Iron ABC transporter system permease n=1 Tax=Enterococcus phoeniculicola ATCC BAA-412 TaxID=1158610 RepID=R3TWE1_9ENTE|nr:iron chelate uptake ABC transporter family permease subunit [Enterococcus phoeniculicola]EOL45443.1 iron ABC transporter system permease [Enterococcus phoeniculicola ATCC BAA-412]EOT74805.1 iron ABC transporter system permease [Enterococcus phoeniculicola ATCC BAA-412]